MNAEKWQKLILPEQMGNIGSEFSRYLSFSKRGERVLAEKSFEEILALLDLTMSDARWSHRVKELTRLREVVCDTLAGNRVYQTAPEVLLKYFVDFATLVRNAY